MESDPNLIVTLVALTEKASAAFEQPANAARCVRTAKEEEGRADTEVQDHLFITDSEDDHQAQATRILLTFDRPPENPALGFVFGVNEECDICLGPRAAAKGVSGHHFAIFLNGDGSVLLRDFSSKGTAISYNKEARDERRTNFVWHMMPGYNIKIFCGSMRFRLILGTHDTCLCEYYANVEEFFRRPQPILTKLATSMHALGVWSSHTTAAPSGAQSPARKPIYLLHGLKDQLGTGGFGSVYKCVDVSTARVYAAKEFRNGLWQRETSILSKISHRHVIQYIDFTETPVPRLIMEYMPLGSLDRQHGISLITLEQAIMCLAQMLDAAQYLHEMRIVHRDIKPANILVESRDPFSIKLADYGLGKDLSPEWATPSHMTNCGTPIYTAPEIANHRYNYVVDVWSIGVVILEYVFGLPKYISPQHSATETGETRSWQRQVVDWVGYWYTDDLVRLLRESMLQLDPRRRCTARQCLEIARNLEQSGYEMCEENELFRGAHALQRLASADVRGTPRNDSNEGDRDETLWRAILSRSNRPALTLASSRPGSYQVPSDTATVRNQPREVLTKRRQSSLPSSQNADPSDGDESDDIDMVAEAGEDGDCGDDDRSHPTSSSCSAGRGVTYPSELYTENDAPSD